MCTYSKLASHLISNIENKLAEKYVTKNTMYNYNCNEKWSIYE